MFEQIKDIEGAGFLFALFIIWKLVEELLRYKGVKRYRKATGDNPGHGNKCKLTSDHHHWFLEMRDYQKSNKHIFRKLEKFLDKELNK